MSLIANDTAAPYISGALTPADFLGPPMVVVGDNLTEDDGRWQAAVNFADALGAPLDTSAPLVGCTPDDFEALRSRLMLASRFYEPSHLRNLEWANGAGGPSRALPACALFLSFPSSLSVAFPTVESVWNESENWIRAPGANLYGIGSFGCGKAIPDQQLSPPVYTLPHDLSGSGSDRYSATLRRLLIVWSGRGPLRSADVAALAAQEPKYNGAGELIGGDPARAGISTRTHPSIRSYILLSLLP